MISKIGSLAQYEGPVLVDRIITNSTALSIADSVRTAAGFMVAGAANNRVLGHIESFIGQDGLTPVKDGTFLQNLGQTYTSSASNQTVAKVRARVDISTLSLYSADPSAVLGTTAGSNLAGKYFTLSTAALLAESSVTEVRLILIEGTPNTMTVNQYYSHGINPVKTTALVSNIVYSEVFGF